jgi:phage shock protein C
MMAKRLYRSTTECIIAGVCGGLGRFLGIDPVIIRVFFVLGLWAGFSMFLYPLLWIILPREDRAEATPGETFETGAMEMAEKARAFGSQVHRALSALSWLDPHRRSASSA